MKRNNYKNFNRKNFSQRLYDKFDYRAKVAAKSLLESIDKRAVIIPEENFKADIELIHPTTPAMNQFVEVQIITSWANTDYPYACLDLLKSKVDRLYRLHGNNLYFMVINTVENRCLKVRASIALESPVVVKKNRYSRNIGELFYRIELKHCEFLSFN